MWNENKIDCGSFNHFKAKFVYRVCFGTVLLKWARPSVTKKRCRCIAPQTVYVIEHVRCLHTWACSDERSLALRPQNAASVISKDVVISETTGSFPVNKVLPFLNHIYLCVFYAWEISNLHLWMVSEWAVFTAECCSWARSLLVFSIFLCVMLSHIFTVLVSSLGTFHTTFNVCICLCCRPTLGQLCSGPARHQVTDITQKNLLTVLITAKCLCTVSSWTLMIFTEIQSAQVRRPLPEPFFSPSPLP